LVRSAGGVWRVRGLDGWGSRAGWFAKGLRRDRVVCERIGGGAGGAGGVERGEDEWCWHVIGDAERMDD
jgi:hypothetical protein